MVRIKRMSTALATLAGKLAERVGMDSVDPQELIATLRQTAFKGNASDAQFIALLIVANQYGLNPWTKEIYAFPDKQNGIVPVVGVDGWSRIINENQQFDGMDFEQDNESWTESRPTRSASFPASVASAVLIRFIPLNQYQPGDEQWFQPCTGCAPPRVLEIQHRHQMRD